MSLLLFNRVLEFLIRIGQAKEIKRHIDKKGRRKTVSADVMILYMENLKNPTKNTVRTCK
jgi:hypothetical protein